MGELVLATFDWVPQMPRGYVRDLRVRWALEEAGLLTASKACRFTTGMPGISRISPSGRCRG